MNARQMGQVIDALHEAMHEGGLIEATDDHGGDDQRRDDDVCIALAGDLVMKRRARGLTIAKRRSDAR